MFLCQEFQTESHFFQQFYKQLKFLVSVVSRLVKRAPWTDKFQKRDPVV
jgi:hypothetical protein